VVCVYARAPLPPTSSRCPRRSSCSSERAASLDSAGLYDGSLRGRFTVSRERRWARAAASGAAEEASRTAPVKAGSGGRCSADEACPRASCSQDGIPSRPCASSARRSSSKYRARTSRSSPRARDPAPALSTPSPPCDTAIPGCTCIMEHEPSHSFSFLSFFVYIVLFKIRGSSDEARTDARRKMKILTVPPPLPIATRPQRSCKTCKIRDRLYIDLTLQAPAYL
jgi:hypothetical protein